MENKNINDDFLSNILSNLKIPKEDEFIMQETISKKYKILIFGGLGFIGKNFFEFINKFDLFSFIIIADKSLPEISHIPANKLNEYIKNPKLKTYQIDLCVFKHVRKIFDENPNIDIAVNLASETRLSLSEEDYHNRCYKLPIICARLAAEYNVKKFIQVSCCKIYRSSSHKLKENSDLEPWDIRYNYAMKAEKELKVIKNLDLVILRFGHVYGPYDFNGEIILRIAASFVYKNLNEKMKVMWDGGLKINTINVLDVCRAIIYSIIQCNNGDIFNVVDENDTDQNKLHEIFKELFKINIECIGSVRSYFLRLGIDKAIQMFNEKHLQTWFNLCNKCNILNTPVNVVVYKENLTNNNMYIDGSAFAKRLNFKCLIPYLETNYFKALIKEYISNGLLPEFQ